ncbi:MAG TPA: hypothetical protein VGE74_07435, partial [Gemmata sp.]
MVTPVRRFGLLAVALGFAAAVALAEVPVAPAPRPVAKPPVSPLVRAEKGALPVIISAPHGGTRDVPGVAPRKGDGLPTGGNGFFSGRDGGTEELAGAISGAITKRF